MSFEAIVHDGRHTTEDGHPMITIAHPANNSHGQTLDSLIDYRTFCIDIHIKFNSTSSWYMNLSDYMGGRCLWKHGWWGPKKSAFFPLQVFFSGIALTVSSSELPAFEIHKLWF